MKLHRLFRIVAVNVALLVAAIVVLELIFGHWIRSDHLGRLNIVRGQREYDVSHLYHTDHPVITYTRDEYGLRGDYSSPDSIDILTIGGSTTDQRDLADGQTWQDVLEREFAKRGRRVVVVNAGVDGQSTYGHIKDFDWWFPYIPNLHARYYLFYVGINDFFREEGHWFDALEKGTPLSVTGQISEKSALYNVARMIHGTFHARVVYDLTHRSIDFSKHRWTDRPLLDNHPALMHDRLEAYRGRLRELCARVAEAGGTPIFVTPPSRRYRKTPGGVVGSAETFPFERQEANGMDYYYMIRLLDDVTMEVCHECGGVCIDMAAETTWDNDDFYDYVHNTPKGAQKVGRYLYEKLKPLFP